MFPELLLEINVRDGYHQPDCSVRVYHNLLQSEGISSKNHVAICNAKKCLSELVYKDLINYFNRTYTYVLLCPRPNGTVIGICSSAN